MNTFVISYSNWVRTSLAHIYIIGRTNSNNKCYNNINIILIEQYVHSTSSISYA